MLYLKVVFCLDLIFREGDGKASRIISANWVRDEDISRLLMSLPNWTNLQVNRDKRGIECPPPYLSSTRGRTWKSYENATK